MASSSMSPASTSFGRLVKSSKVISHFDPSIPLVYTSHGGSKKRSDYGLKRALPKIKTAAIRVHSLDNSMTNLTDFSYAAREHCFVGGFRESNVKVGGPQVSESVEHQRSRIQAAGQAAGACAWDKKSFQSISDLKKKLRTGDLDATTLTARAQQGFEALVGPAVPSTRDSGSSVDKAGSLQDPSITDAIKASLRFPQDYLHMSEAEFKHFLSKLKQLQPKFTEYLKTIGFMTESGRQLQIDLLKVAESAADRLGVIDDFLAQELPALEAGSKKPLAHDPKLDHITSKQHFAYGLTYASPNLYMSDQVTRPLPIRALEMSSSGESAFGNKGGKAVAALGTISITPRTELKDVYTAWHIDADSAYNINHGKQEARVEYAHIQDPALMSQNRSSPDETLYGVKIDEIDNPSNRPTVIDENVVGLKLYKSGQGKGSLRPKRIGSAEWVETSVERPQMATAIESGDLAGLFETEPRIRAPRNGLFMNPASIPGRKSQLKRDDNSDDPVNSLISKRQRPKKKRLHPSSTGWS